MPKKKSDHNSYVGCLPDFDSMPCMRNYNKEHIGLCCFYALCKLCCKEIRISWLYSCPWPYFKI